MVGVISIHRDWVDWLVIGATGVALALAVWQSFRSGRIARAAKDAVERTERQLVSNQLIDKSGVLGRKEGELLKSIDDNDGRTRDHLIEWRNEASALIGVVEGMTNQDQDLLKSLRAVVTSINASLPTIGDDKGSLRGKTKTVTTCIGDAVGHLSRYAGSLKAHTDRSP